jgi:hypothetical protein
MYRAICVSVCSLSILVLRLSLASADSGMTYTISGDYSPSTSISQLTGPSDTFSLSFTLPVQPVTTNFLLGEDFYVDSPVQYSYSASNEGSSSWLVYLSFYSLSSISQTGGLLVDFCADGPDCASGLEYHWMVPGSLLYSGPESSPTLTPTSFDFTGGQFLLYHCTFCNNLDATGTFTGNVNALSTPEPRSACCSVSSLLACLRGCLAPSSVVKIQSNALRPGEWVITAGKNSPREHIALCSKDMGVRRPI